jgi:hypothetical protein
MWPTEAPIANVVASSRFGQDFLELIRISQFTPITPELESASCGGNIPKINFSRTLARGVLFSWTSLPLAIALARGFIFLIRIPESRAP